MCAKPEPQREKPAPPGTAFTPVVQARKSGDKGREFKVIFNTELAWAT